MDEAPMTNEQLVRALSVLARDVAFPATSALAPAVTARLLADRAARTRPRLPSLALWSRRRVLVLVTIGLLAALAVAAAARLTIGAVEIRVRPGATPSASLPPITADVLGDPMLPAEAAGFAGFEPDLPAGLAPDEAYVLQSPFGDPGLVYVWRPSSANPEIPGTTWGLVLMAFQGDDETVVKEVQRFEDVRPASVNGRHAFWIPVPHTLLIQTDRGELTLSVRGNVLIWQVGDVTFRLETALDRAGTLAIARSIGLR
jgi:hypothetical protein